MPTLLNLSEGINLEPN
nr:unnamed protein product [Callosobruchus chinensis]